MVSMEGVPSSLILRNESWVRKHASALARRLPSNVERADLIQVGLIAVAQAALCFHWEGDRESPEARDAFVRYARQRVHGAMLDELRQMDQLSRERRRQVKLVQVARERWLGTHGSEPSATELAALCGLSVDEVFELEHAAQQAQAAGGSGAGGGFDDDEDARPAREPATSQDEVEARVDTGMLMRRLESFFATLPERDRQVIDAYLGVGLSPSQLAQALQVSPSRVSQMFKAVCTRIGEHLAPARQRSTDRAESFDPSRFDDLVTARESELASHGAAGAWGARLAEVLGTPEDIARRYPAGEPIVVDNSTRWG
ncbi:MAG: flagellar biosynthesis protein FliA [Leptothrix sp. (in: Bacteria)]|nr:flagellar biosynthesis protein FliA [Leptothrix sp. (in: b-proteobacteria)]